MHTIIYYLSTFWLVITNPFRRTYTSNVCKHRTKRAGSIVSGGHRLLTSMPLAANGSPDYCLDCIAGMSIKCAWCDNPISIGDPVTLYVAGESCKIPEHAVRLKEDPRRLVGCLGFDCAETGADRQGFWVPPGRVEQMDSPIDVLFKMFESGDDSEHIVIVDDLSNSADTGKVV